MQKEIWKPIKGSCNYEVSNRGRIRSVTRMVYSGRGNYRINEGRVCKAYIGKDNRPGIKIPINGKLVSKRISRLVAKAFLIDWDEELHVDHINGDMSDNRVENLRMATHRENMRAFRRSTEGSTSKYRGVSWCTSKEKWYAQIKHRGRNRHIGLFDTEEEAAIAWNQIATKFCFWKEALNNVA